MKTHAIMTICLLCILLTGCATKWLPDADSPLNPPVAYQQQFIAEAIDDVFSTMDFSRLRGEIVEIEVMGVYPDGDIADYLRAKLQLELAKAGAKSETSLLPDSPTYKANIMLRYGGVNDVVKSAPFYQWRQKLYEYDVQIAVFDINGGDYFIQSGRGSNEATIARYFYVIFFPIPLPTEWSTTKGHNFFYKINQTYDASKRVYQNPDLMMDRSLMPEVIE